MPTSHSKETPPQLDYISTFKLASRNFVVGLAFGNIGVIIPIVQQRSLKPILKRLTLKHARLAIALFQFTLVYKYLSSYRRKSRTLVEEPEPSPDTSTTFWSATAAGTCILVLSQTQRIEYTLTALARSFDILISRHVISSNVFVRNHSQIISNISTVVFILSAWEIIWSWFYYPQTLPKSYVKWITRMSEIDTDLLKFLRYLKDGKVKYYQEVGYGLEDELTPYCHRIGIDPEYGDVRNGFLECDPLVHKGMFCWQNALFRSFNGFKKSFLIYFPLYMSVFVFSLLKASKRNLNTSIYKVLNSILVIITSSLRSSLFLSTFIGIIWAVECQVRNFLRDDTIFGPLLGSALCGCSILIERPSRRAELAYYCLPRALYSLIYRIIWKNVIYSKHSTLWIGLLNMTGLISFCLSVGTIVSQSFHAPQNVRPMMRILVTYLLEKP